jgi:hypothetical protein
MNEGVDECVVESHISKLRKKLRTRLGEDPIESTRYIGYMLKASATGDCKAASKAIGRDTEASADWLKNTAAGLSAIEMVA